MHIRLISTEDEAYNGMKALRWRVLLQPIGVPESYINPEREKEDLLIVAREAKEVIGCCILSHLDDTIQLRQMAVDNLQQTSGLGRAIVLFAEETAREKGYKVLMMHARDAVIPFYQKCGYKISGDGFEEVGIPHHRMEKLL
jgi:N-acetylglutamate synthase-like GNAT family acetyltransferase